MSGLTFDRHSCPTGSGLLCQSQKLVNSCEQLLFGLCVLSVVEWGELDSLVCRASGIKGCLTSNVWANFQRFPVELSERPAKIVKELIGDSGRNLRPQQLKEAPVPPTPSVGLTAETEPMADPQANKPGEQRAKNRLKHLVVSAVIAFLGGAAIGYWWPNRTDRTC